MHAARRLMKKVRCNRHAQVLTLALLCGGVETLAADPLAKPVVQNVAGVKQSRSEIIFKSQWQLTSNLLKELMQERPNSNLLIAPDALTRCMRLVAIGARGETLEQLESVFPATQDSGFKIPTEDDSKPAFKWDAGFVAGPNGGYGLVVNAVTRDSGAANAGLRVNDAILSVNRRSTQNTRLLSDLIEKSDGFIEMQWYQYRTGEVVENRINLARMKAEKRTPTFTYNRYVVVEQTLKIDDIFHSAASETFGGTWLRHDFQGGGSRGTHDWADKPFEPLGVLKDKLKANGPATRLLVFSEFGLKSEWARLFSDIPENEFKFTSFDGKHVQVPAFGAARQVYISKTDLMEMVMLPLKEEDLWVHFILPAGKDANDHLAALNDFLPDQIESMRSEEVDVAIPKFKFSSDIEFKSLLEKLGVRDAFSAKADFGLISSQSDLNVASVLQNTEIACDQGGVSATAKTSVQMSLKSAGPDRNFHLDRPFFFFITRRSSGEIFFAGRVVKP